MGAPAFQPTEELLEVIKARAHKYLRRYRGKDGKYRYVYPKKAGGGKAGSRHEGGSTDHKSYLGDKSIYKPGTSLAAGAGKGHYIIESTKGNSITFHLDEDEKGNKGESRTMSYGQFRQMLRNEHRENFKRAAREGLQRRKNVLAKTQPGTPAHKRAENEVRRWESLNSDYLPRGSARKRAFGALGKFVKDGKERSEVMRQLLGVDSFTQASTEDINALAGKLEAATQEDFQRMLHGGENASPDPAPSKRQAALQKTIDRRKKDLAQVEQELATAKRGNDTPRIEEYTRERDEALARIKKLEAKLEVKKALLEVVKAKIKGQGRWVTTKDDKIVFLGGDGKFRATKEEIEAYSKEAGDRETGLEATQRGINSAVEKLNNLGPLPKSYSDASKKIGELEKVVQRASDAHSHAKKSGLMNASGSDTSAHKETRQKIKDSMSAIQKKIDEYKKASPHSDHIVKLQKLSSKLGGSSEIKKALLSRIKSSLSGKKSGSSTDSKAKAAPKKGEGRWVTTKDDKRVFLGGDGKFRATKEEIEAYSKEAGDPQRESSLPTTKVPSEADFAANGAKVVGKGGFGTVYAHDGPPPHCVKYGRVNDREKDIQQKAGELGVAPLVYATGKNSIMMEYCNNHTSLARHKKTPTALRNSIEAIRTLHESGIAHNDAHAGNILLDSSKKATVIDFGASIESSKEAVIEAVFREQVLSGRRVFSANYHHARMRRLANHVGKLEEFDRLARGIQNRMVKPEYHAKAARYRQLQRKIIDDMRNEGVPIHAHPDLDNLKALQSDLKSLAVRVSKKKMQEMVKDFYAGFDQIIMGDGSSGQRKSKKAKSAAKASAKGNGREEGSSSAADSRGAPGGGSRANDRAGSSGSRPGALKGKMDIKKALVALIRAQLEGVL